MRYDIDVSFLNNRVTLNYINLLSLFISIKLINVWIFLIEKFNFVERYSREDMKYIHYTIVLFDFFLLYFDGIIFSDYILSFSFI